MAARKITAAAPWATQRVVSGRRATRWRASSIATQVPPKMTIETGLWVTAATALRLAQMIAKPNRAMRWKRRRLGSWMAGPSGNNGLRGWMGAHSGQGWARLRRIARGR